MSSTKEDFIAKYPFLPDIVQRIKAVLQERGHSQRSFAAEIGIHKGHVSKMMSMQCLPSANILIRMAQKGYDVNNLITGKEDESRECLKTAEAKLKELTYYVEKLESLLTR